MELTLTTAILLPMGLGLLGFVEPCTIGAHLIYLRSQGVLPPGDRARSLVVFILVRAIVAGLFGGLLAFLGEMLIGMQTTLWLVFGFIYLAVGVVFLADRSRLLRLRISLAPEAWKEAQNPVVLGLAFGLNIPACAAPILFGLLGLAATLGSAAVGFLMMFLFGLFLSLPLGVFLLAPGFGEYLASLRERTARMRWLAGLVFAGLGLWSIWFGLTVNPADWTGQ